MKKKIVLGIMMTVILILNLINLYVYAAEEDDYDETQPNILIVRTIPASAKIINEEQPFMIHIYNIPESEKENVKFTIDNESRAKITRIDLCKAEDGSTKSMIMVYVKFLELGNASLTASITYEGKKCSDVENFTIIESPYSLKISTNDNTDLPTNLNIGDTKQLKALFVTYGGSILPEDVTNKGTTWKSSNEQVIKVDAKGLVTAAGSGTATITATYKYGQKELTTTYSLNVIDSSKPSASPSATAEPTTSPTATTEPIVSPSATSSSSTTPNNNPKKIDSSVAKTILPNTGTNTVIIFVGILLVAVILTITYTNSRDEKNQ